MMRDMACRLAILGVLAGVVAGAAEPQDAPPKPGRPEAKKREKPAIEKARKGPPAARGLDEDDDDRGGPPAGVPPPAARGFVLSRFIAAAKAKGLDGEALAAAIHGERRRLGLVDEGDDD